MYRKTNGQVSQEESGAVHTTNKTALHVIGISHAQMHRVLMPQLSCMYIHKYSDIVTHYMLTIIIFEQ